MDLTKVKCISNTCVDNNVTMRGGGAHMGGILSTFQFTCPVCDLTLMLVPMREGYSYRVRAETEADIDKRIEKERKLRELETKYKEMGEEIQHLRREV